MKFKDKRTIEDVLKESASAETFKGSDGMENSVTNTISEDDVPEHAGNKTVGQPAQPTKVAELQILLKRVVVTAPEGATVLPERCPGVGRAEDHGKDEDGNPACVHNDNKCPYFVDAIFTLQDFNKVITCSLGKGE